MKMKPCSVLLLLLVIIYMQVDFLHCDDAHDDEDMLYYLNRLYEEDSNEGDLDPHDMLASPGRVNKVPRTTGSFSSTPHVEDSVTPKNMVQGTGSIGCEYENKMIEESKKEIEMCRGEITSVDKLLQKERQRSAGLEKKITKEGKEDMGAFYKRSVLHLYKNLKMKEVSDILHDESSAIIRHISVRIQKNDVDNFKNFMDSQSNPLKIDEFLEHSFETLAPAEPWNFDIFAGLTQTYQSLTSGLRNIELWLNILCAFFLCLGVWAIMLFVKDIQRELRWMRLLWMMIVIVFFICCLWHWRHLHKQAEARRHAAYAKRGFSDMPEECRPGGKSDPASAWDWIKVKVFGSPDVCEKYYEEMMIDTMEEISPSMVIAEALAKFILQPLQHIGTHSGQLFSNFFAQVPVVYQVQAGIMFIILIVIILLVTCGYGIDFPFWLGGIRPHYRPEGTEQPDVNQITREALEMLRADRDKFMLESQTMLMDITRAAVSQSQTGLGVQPLLVTSGNIIETQLERLISQRFSNVIQSPASIEAPSNSAQVISPIAQHTENYHQVDTITSTPLRTSHIKQAAETVDGPTPVSGIKVKTDAIHYRLKGESRQSPLDKEESIQNNRPQVLPGDTSSLMPPPSPHESSPGCAVRRRKPLFVKQSKNVSNTSFDSQAVENHPGDSIKISNSLNENLDTSCSSEVFVEQVKRVLEESANSSMNVSRDEGGVLDTSSKKESFRYPIDQVDYNKSIQEEELEISAHGKSFLNEVQNAVTP